VISDPRPYQFWPPSSPAPAFTAVADDVDDACRQVLKWLSASSWSVVEHPINPRAWWAEFQTEDKRLLYWVGTVERQMAAEAP